MSTLTRGSPFSSQIEGLQIVWDATSLSALMKCPRYYQYTIIEGYRYPGNVDIAFGKYFASSVEVFKKARLRGLSKAEATLETVKYTVLATWDPEKGPWGGQYEQQWHCTGVQPYKNRKGNRAKCPWSHKGEWFPAPAPTPCGECGSPTEAARRWVSNDPAKDRYSLIRMVVWWADEQPERAIDGPIPYAFPDGTPAVELSAPITLPWSTSSRERYILTGYFDDISVLGQENFINDNKTTKKTLNKLYWKQFSPNVQVDTYDLIGSVFLPDLHIRGVRIDAAQALVGGARFGTQVFYRSDVLREEYLQDLRYWLDQAEVFAQKQHWPMNRASCYTCPFSGVCSKEPDKREQYLKANFEVRLWNPLAER